MSKVGDTLYDDGYFSIKKALADDCETLIGCKLYLNGIEILPTTNIAELLVEISNQYVRSQKKSNPRP